MNGGAQGVRAAAVDDGHVAAVIAIEDPAARNRAITETYHALAQAMRAVVGPADATWCAFAVWASRTVGAEIRAGGVADAVRDRLAAAPEYHRAHRWLGDRFERAVLRVAADAADTVSRSLAAGNGLVFAELAPVFVALVEGRRPPGGSAPEVAEAAALYEGARREPDPRRRAQLVLHGNLVAVLHEQTRLQAPVTVALDAAPSAGLHELARHELGHWVAHELAGPLRPALDRLDRAWEEVVTEKLMTIRTGDEVLHLGRDLPPRPGQPLFPPELSAPLLPGLARFCAEHDGTGLTGVGSAARDWRDLSQRMTYILNLFRSRQRDPALFTPPFPPPAA